MNDNAVALRSLPVCAQNQTTTSTNGSPEATRPTVHATGVKDTAASLGDVIIIDDDFASETAKPARPRGRKIIYTLFVVCCMVPFMTLYNSVRHLGMAWTPLEWLSLIVIVFPIAFICANTVGGWPAAWVAKRFRSRVREGFVKKNFVAIHKVPTMVFLMGGIMSTILNGAFSPVDWAITFVCALPVGLLWNIFVAGPIARRLYKAIFKEAF